MKLPALKLFSHSKNCYSPFLRKQNITPILLDVGASGQPPQIWDMIAAASKYIGFDPDLRDIKETNGDYFLYSTIVNKAVTDDPEASQIKFFLTRSPHCSSTLPPDSSGVSEYIFSHFFDVEREVQVNATTFNNVLDQLNIPHIHWIKLDSQGTDLRLIQSLSSDRYSNLLALDIEPGLMDAYEGEDLFVTAHTYLTQNGFWLSNADVCGTVRMNRTQLPYIAQADARITEKYINFATPRSPGWCEARYLRTVGWLDDHQLPQDSYLLLWLFSLIDEQYGFAVDIITALEKRFGTSVISQEMLQETVKSIKLSHRKVVARKIIGRIERWLI